MSRFCEKPTNDAIPIYSQLQDLFELNMKHADIIGIPEFCDKEFDIPTRAVISGKAIDGEADVLILNSVEASDNEGYKGPAFIVSLCIDFSTNCSPNQQEPSLLKITPSEAYFIDQGECMASKYDLEIYSDIIDDLTLKKP